MKLYRVSIFRSSVRSLGRVISAFFSINRKHPISFNYPMRPTNHLSQIKRYDLDACSWLSFSLLYSHATVEFLKLTMSHQNDKLWICSVQSCVWYICVWVMVTWCESLLSVDLIWAVMNINRIVTCVWTTDYYCVTRGLRYRLRW